MLKDILVHLDHTASGPTRLEAAVALASGHDAHLTALFVKPQIPIMPTGYYKEVLSLAEMIDRFNDDFKKSEQLCHQRFEELLKRSAVRGTWRFVQADPKTCVMSHARCSDVIVLGQALKDDAPSVATLPESVLFGAGRPIISMPQSLSVRPKTGNVLVAWNGSREASRAVHDALPILKVAKSVNVLCVNPEDKPDEISGSDIAEHLARHDIRVYVRSINSGLERAGLAIRSYAAAHGFDMVVMGGYGHARLREIILSGVTYDLLKNSTVPLFLSH